MEASLTNLYVVQTGTLAGSGWNQVPLVDLVEAHSVKRAYQKALLRLHPDKLQTGAASHRKYAAEKIFEILQVHQSKSFLHILDKQNKLKSSNGMKM